MTLNNTEILIAEKLNDMLTDTCLNGNVDDGGGGGGGVDGAIFGIID